MSLAGLVPTALGQTDSGDDILQPGSAHNLGSLAGILRCALWALGAVLLVVALVLAGLRYRVVTNLYKASSDEQWVEDAKAETGEPEEESDAGEGPETAREGAEAGETAEPAAETARPPQVRVFTPASGTAWDEPMLKAFLSTCMKVNCLGRTWRESAAWRVQSPNMPDPREAELIRRLMQRWQQFHVDPESGVFFEHASAAGKSRVCIIRVLKDKRTLVEAAFNAGFVIESVGRYLKNTDLVCSRGLGDYHAPTKDELAAMTPGDKESLIRIADIPDPWQAMIAGARLRR